MLFTFPILLVFLDYSSFINVIHFKDFKMPTISVKKRLLDKHLGSSLSQEDVDELCFQYGLELDDVVCAIINKS